MRNEKWKMENLIFQPTAHCSLLTAQGFVLASLSFCKKPARAFPDCVVLARYVLGGLHFLCALLSAQVVLPLSCDLWSRSHSWALSHTLRQRNRPIQSIVKSPI